MDQLFGEGTEKDEPLRQVEYYDAVSVGFVEILVLYKKYKNEHMVRLELDGRVHEGRSDIEGYSGTEWAVYNAVQDLITSLTIVDKASVEYDNGWMAVCYADEIGARCFGYGITEDQAMDKAHREVVFTSAIKIEDIILKELTNEKD